MKSELRSYIRQRAGDRCEYCRLPQHALPFATFHIEHIIARQHGGATDSDNLALACDRCNLFKGPNLTGIDPATQMTIALFNPRTMAWTDHFRQIGWQVEGVSPIGRATVNVLNMNAQRRIQLREQMQIQLNSE